ncbi:gamma-glutamyltransferase [Nannocystis sp. RBIL2]|uniref:gamma-glutamyltransferase n=1 Tax=Nannocystis sp. RBIL2 TaxID=2996788 RepID=UPI00226F1CE1|nr:gamma-glutamyltransferase [Nannocystis sp. RBIL2]MCY1071485.1 gamma-glutamyltransferase [Nannocystis sp. RBIL2]
MGQPRHLHRHHRAALRDRPPAAGLRLLPQQRADRLRPAAGRPNSPAPDKRPLSSMAPTLVFQGGEPVYVLGSPGGPRIITAVAQVLLDLLEYDLDIEQAIAKPRIYSALCNEKARWESDLPRTVRDELEALGHRFRDEPLEVGDVSVIAVDGGTYVGVADPRRDGVAVGITRVDGD